jgi:NAD(P)H-dependent FMN reductase
MGLDLLLFYGSYRTDRRGVRLVRFLTPRLEARGHAVELIDARVVGLPMLDRMYKEFPKGEAPQAMERLAGRVREADGFVFVAGEYNWGQQPGLKNLTDHFLEEWFWRPAAIASYSGSRIPAARANLIWHGTLSEMGMVVISSTLQASQVSLALDESGAPTGEGGDALERSFPNFVADLEWWCEAAKAQRAVRAPPY